MYSKSEFQKRNRVFVKRSCQNRPISFYLFQTHSIIWPISFFFCFKHILFCFKHILLKIDLFVSNTSHGTKRNSKRPASNYYSSPCLQKAIAVLVAVAVLSARTWPWDEVLYMVGERGYQVYSCGPRGVDRCVLHSIIWPISLFFCFKHILLFDRYHSRYHSILFQTHSPISFFLRLGFVSNTFLHVMLSFFRYHSLFQTHSSISFFLVRYHSF